MDAGGGATLQAAGEQQGGQCFRVSGVLDFESVPGLLRASAPLFRDHPRLLLDLAGVQQADSAALALLVEWRRQAPGAALRLVNAPAALRSLAQLCEVDRLLQL